MDAGPHPDPSEALDGKRLRVLEPHPDYALIVPRIYAEFLAGAAIKAIASTLTADGILSRSASDPELKNRHCSSRHGEWGQSAVRTVLKNPRYTGCLVRAGQGGDEGPRCGRRRC